MMLFRRRAERPARRAAGSRPAPARVTATASATRGPVWLGFADSSGVTLAADDPAALALRAVAEAMLRGR